jgi:2-dehydropantoate 2-reductase
VVETDEEPPYHLKVPVVTDPTQIEGSVEWVVLAVKSHQTESARSWLNALVGLDTVVAVAQNGVEHEQRLRPIVPSVLPVIVNFPATQLEPGRVRVEARPELIVPRSRHGLAFTHLFLSAPVDVEVSSSFSEDLWRKLCGNAIGSIMALTGHSAEIFRNPDIRAVAAQLGSECVAVAAAEGVHLPSDLGYEVACRLADAPPQRVSSIATDRAAGRPMEWSALNGAVSRIGERHGVPTPVNDLIVTLLSASDGGGHEESHRLRSVL